MAQFWLERPVCSDGKVAKLRNAALVSLKRHNAEYGGVAQFWLERPVCSDGKVAEPRETAPVRQKIFSTDMGA